MPKFRVRATVEVNCYRDVEAIDEEDAIEQCEGMGGNEWIEGHTVENEHVEIDSADLISAKKKK